ncbi:MAG: glycosyltransferase N-terminal domain-containing protein [Bacteroidia bacterium]
MLFYNFTLFIYWCAVHIASLFNEKAKLWVAGRKNSFPTIKKTLIEKDISGNIIWFHCASLGEFEQGRPVIESIKKTNSQQKIVLTFFSPSGYEIRKNYEFADAVFYLPLDFKSNAKKFIHLIKPTTAIFVKYEFWLNYLNQLKKQNIPTYLISATFRPDQHFFKWYGGIFFKVLKSYKKIFLQDENSFQLLKQHGLTNIEIAGDTRFDRVIEIQKNFEEIKQIKDFKANHKLIIAGSTWAKDDELILDTFSQLKNKNCKLLLVPHEVDKKSISETILKIKQHKLNYSLYTEPINNNADVLVLNTIGLLSKIYFYADVAYIGGSFNGGLHNCLEAAVYGVPVAFYGKEYLNYNEAVGLVKIGAAISARNSHELLKAFTLFLEDEKLHKEIENKLQVFFNENSNSTDKILKSIPL